VKAAAIAAIIVIVMALLLALQYSRVVSLRGEVAIETKARQEAVAANLESEATITTLRAEAKRNADYQTDLNKRLQASQTKARKAEKDFETLKRNSKPVRDWADQPLPDGLRGKATSSDKDKRAAN
jgi:LysB family phage lysis regulatory protein